MMQLLQKYQKGETQFAVSIGKGVAAFQIVGGKSMSTSLEATRVQMMEEQACRVNFAKKMEEESERLNAYTKTYAKNAHQLSQKTHQEINQYDAKVAQLNKAKGHYHNCCRNEEQLRESLANPDLEPSKQTSLTQQLEKASENKSQAQDQYAVMVNDHDKIHEEYILACRDILNQYEQLEIALNENIKGALTSFATQRTDLNSSLSSQTSSITSSINTINISADIISFVEQNSKGLEPDEAPQYEEFNTSGENRTKRKTLKLSLKNSKLTNVHLTKIRKGKKKGKGEGDMTSPRDETVSPRASGDALSPRASPPREEEEVESKSISKAKTSTRSMPSLPIQKGAAPPPAGVAPATPPLVSGSPRANRGPAPAPPRRSDETQSPPVAGTRAATVISPRTPTRRGGDVAPQIPTNVAAARGPAPLPPSRGAGDSSSSPPSRPGARWKIAVALYDNPSESESELGLHEGCVFFVINEDPTGWWLGASGSSVGFFPGNYVKYLEEDEQLYYVRAKAIEDFTGSYDGDLSFRAGDTLTILEYKENWYTGRKASGQVGIFPCHCVNLLVED